jgi:hypothetical protein
MKRTLSGKHVPDTSPYPGSRLRGHQFNAAGNALRICFRKRWDTVRRPPLLLIPRRRNAASRPITPPTWPIRHQPPNGVSVPALVVGPSGHHHQADTMCATTALTPHTATEHQQDDQNTQSRAVLAAKGAVLVATDRPMSQQARDATPARRGYPESPRHPDSRFEVAGEITPSTGPRRQESVRWLAAATTWAQRARSRSYDETVISMTAAPALWRASGRSGHPGPLPPGIGPWATGIGSLVRRNGRAPNTQVPVSCVHPTHASDPFA